MRHEAQTCDWFLFSFRKIVNKIAAEHGAAIEINEAVLREDFRPADIAATYAAHGAACLDRKSVV